MPKPFPIDFAALVAAFMLPAATLEAATYTLRPTSVTNNPASAPFIAFTPADFPTVALAIQDSAIASGAFAVSYGYSPPTFTGDIASLISFTIGNFASLTPGFGGVSAFRANLQFNSDGSVNAGTLLYSSDRFEVDFSGTGSAFGGTFVPSDNLYPGSVSGTFTAVPEPASFALLATALTAALRRRNRVEPRNPV